MSPVYTAVQQLMCRYKTLFASVMTATMTSARNSIYSTHSIADAHLLAILDDKKDNRQLDTQPSRLSVLLPTKFLETVLILPGTSFRKFEDDIAGHRQSATSFDDMQRSVQVIGLSKPERSKPRLSHTFEPEHIIDNAPFDDEPQDYDSEPQMRYTAPNQASNALVPEYRQQGCGYRHPTYYGPCGGVGYCGYNRGYSGPQRPPQAYFPGGRRQRRYGGGYYYGAGGCGYGRGGYPAYNGSYYTQRPILVRRHGGCCCCC
jgi:hypothetical protein